MHGYIFEIYELPVPLSPSTGGPIDSNDKKTSFDNIFFIIELYFVFFKTVFISLPNGKWR